MSYVFISYSHKDSEYAYRLANAIEDSRISVWIDERIDYGEQWPDVIEEHVDNCSAFILLMTPNSKASSWVKSELSRAQRKKKKIFPLLLDGDEPWLSVESTQYVDVRNGKIPPQKFFNNLSKSVPSNRGKPENSIKERFLKIPAPFRFLILFVLFLVAVIEFSSLIENKSHGVGAPPDILPTATKGTTLDNLSIPPEEMPLFFFPTTPGSSWTFSYVEQLESWHDNTMSIDTESGTFSVQIVMYQTGLSDRVHMVGYENSRENFLAPCYPNSNANFDVDYWYIFDEKDVYVSCDRIDMNKLATDLVRNESPNREPEYSFPFIVGKEWPDDTGYSWRVDAQVSIEVPAGKFSGCYRIVLWTGPDEIIKWICPDVGLVTMQYSHHGSVHDYRAELTDYNIGPK